MSKKLYLLSVLFGALAVFFTPSCNEDLCKDVDCGANGTCFEGTCECNTGYEGTTCETEASAKFAGLYTAKSSCLGANETYAGSIQRISATAIRINEYGGFSGTNWIDATVERANSTDATYQKVSVNVQNDGFNRTITGTGTLSGKVLTLNLTINYNDNGPVDNCTDVLTITQ